MWCVWEDGRSRGTLGSGAVGSRAAREQPETRSARVLARAVGDGGPGRTQLPRGRLGLGLGPSLCYPSLPSDIVFKPCVAIPDAPP